MLGTPNPYAPQALCARMATDPVGVLAMAARPASPEAQTPNHAYVCSLDGEWGKLAGLQTWGDSSACELSTAKHRRHEEGIPAHTGRLSGLCVGAHAELPPDRRKYGGRVVAQARHQQPEDLEEKNAWMLRMNAMLAEDFFRFTRFQFA